ncbi:MAG TPA: MarR family winged helix-turn-helix transcriptional regulator [Desulfosporosinus sp.]|nr:MarR family winged helix-turn-helix transcriptional regulator [Desulfosporosinus sp.]
MDQTPDLQELWSNSAEKIAFLFKSIQKIYREHVFEISKQYGFTGPQFSLIIGLYKDPYKNLNEMSECLGLTKSTVSGMVDRLVAQGVVIREIPENNRRTVRLSISSEFLENNNFKDLMNQYLTDTIKGASEEDIETMVSGLELLLSFVEKNKVGEGIV